MAAVHMPSSTELCEYEMNKTSPSSPIGAAPTQASSAGAVSAGRAVPFVRVAELEIDPVQLEAYEAAVKEEMETSVRAEPGVLAIYAVAEAGNSHKLRFFEMYADAAAYNAHIASVHFKKYVEATKNMIISRKLVDAVPVLLSSKQK